MSALDVGYVRGNALRSVTKGLNREFTLLLANEQLETAYYE